MDALLLEQHLRSSMRLFPEPMLAHFSAQETEAASAALIEKARQHLQMWGRSPYSELLLPHIYQRPNLGALNLGLWQGQWSPQIPPGFLNLSAPPQTPPPQSVSRTSSASGSPPPDARIKQFQRFAPYQIPPQTLQQVQKLHHQQQQQQLQLQDIQEQQNSSNKSVDSD